MLETLALAVIAAGDTGKAEEAWRRNGGDLVFLRALGFYKRARGLGLVAKSGASDLDWTVEMERVGFGSVWTTGRRNAFGAPIGESNAWCTRICSILMEGKNISGPMCLIFMNHVSGVRNRSNVFFVCV